jgi:hypothetical protein
MPDPIPFRAKPRIVLRPVDTIDDMATRIRKRLDGPPRHIGIDEPEPTNLSDYAAGAAAGFLVGIAPFLAMLAIMVWS